MDQALCIHLLFQLPQVVADLATQDTQGPCLTAVDSLQDRKLSQPLRGPWAGAQAPMTTALGLTGDNRFAARLLLVLEIRSAFGGRIHEVKVTLTKEHGSRA